MKVVQLKQEPCLIDVVARLRHLADLIEAGSEGEVDAAYVIIPRPGEFPSVYGYGDIYNENHPVIQLELAKAFFINNLTEWK